MNESSRKDDAQAPGGSATIAAAFVGARRAGVALDAFPGTLPASIDAAYRIQDAAIRAWQDAVAGWKVGYIAPAQREGNGDERLVGPIFARALHHATSEEIDFPVFAGGFAAVEAEFVFRLDRDAAPHKTQWTAAEAGDVVAALHVGIETAGSPLATINALGPRVVISDFGNNAGLIVGPAIAQWRSLAEADMTCETFIEAQRVGAGSASAVAGGLLASLAFALSRCARNGRPLCAGDFITTGAVTGIHEIRSGQHARVDFGALGTIRCRAVEASEFLARSRA